MGNEQQKNGNWHTLRRLADRVDQPTKSMMRQGYSPPRVHWTAISDEDLTQKLLSTIPTPKSTIDREVFELALAHKSAEREQLAEPHKNK